MHILIQCIYFKLRKVNSKVHFCSNFEHSKSSICDIDTVSSRKFSAKPIPIKYRSSVNMIIAVYLTSVVESMHIICKTSYAAYDMLHM